MFIVFRNCSVLSLGMHRAPWKGWWGEGMICLYLLQKSRKPPALSLRNAHFMFSHIKKKNSQIAPKFLWDEFSWGLLRHVLLPVFATDQFIFPPHSFSFHVLHFTGARNKQELVMKKSWSCSSGKKSSNHKIDHWLKPSSDIMSVPIITAAAQCLWSGCKC